MPGGLRSPADLALDAALPFGPALSLSSVSCSDISLPSGPGLRAEPRVLPPALRQVDNAVNGAMQQSQEAVPPFCTARAEHLHLECRMHPSVAVTHRCPLQVAVPAKGKPSKSQKWLRPCVAPATSSGSTRPNALPYATMPCRPARLATRPAPLAGARGRHIAATLRGLASQFERDILCCGGHSMPTSADARMAAAGT